MADNNFEELCGKNGELVRRKQTMLGAVFIEDRRPFEWKLPEV